MTTPPSTVSSSSDSITVMAIGVLSATLAAICHETIGHGLGCLSGGGQISLLTSIWFRCSKWSWLADIGGPAGNLIAGSVGIALFTKIRSGSAAKLFLLMFGALNLFWFMGQLIFESLTATHDDWYTTFQMGSPQILKIAGAIAGIGGYILVTRLLSMLVREQGVQARAIRFAYLGAAVSAVIAGLMWQPAPLRSSLEGFLTLGVTPIGLFRVSRTMLQHHEHDERISVIPRAWIWICIGVVVFGVFLFVQARGLGTTESLPH